MIYFQHDVTNDVHAPSQLVLIGFVQRCLEVTFSRIYLIGRVDYRGMMGSENKHTCSTGPIMWK